jgi:hypothetical protein
MTCLDDLDGNGTLDLVGGGTFSTAGECDIHLWTSDQPYDPADVVIPCFQYNPRRDGVYPTASSSFIIAGPGPSHDNAPLVRVFPPSQGASHSTEFAATKSSPVPGRARSSARMSAASPHPVHH